MPSSPVRNHGHADRCVSVVSGSSGPRGTGGRVLGDAGRRWPADGASGAIASRTSAGSVTRSTSECAPSELSSSRSCVVDRDPLALLLGRQRGTSRPAPGTGRRRPRRPRSCGPRRCRPSGKKAPSVAMRQHVAERLEPVRAVGVELARARRTACRRATTWWRRTAGRWSGRPSASRRRARRRGRPGRRSRRPRRGRRGRPAPRRPGRVSRDSGLSPMSPTQTEPSPPGASASTSLRVVAPAGGADGLPGGRVDGEDPAGVAGVVGGDHQAVDERQPAGLDDLGVLEGEHHLGDSVRPARRRRRAGTARRPARRASRSGIRPSSSSASRGRMPQVATRSSYSRRSEPPLTGAPVRVARSRVLRGVCLLSTNCTTSTR